MRKQWFWILFGVFIGGSLYAQSRGGPPPPPPGPGPVLVLCPVTTTLHGGIADSFALPADTVQQSSALVSFLSGLSTRQYDEEGCDRFLGQSFTVSTCVFCQSICSAELEITYKTCGSPLACNDTVTVGRAPFAAGDVITTATLHPACRTNDPFGPLPIESFVRFDPSIPPGPVVRRIPLDVDKLKQLCLAASGGPFTIDVIVQDDTVVDSMSLVLTHN